MKFVQTSSASIQVNNDLEIAHPHSVSSSTMLGRTVGLAKNKPYPHMMSTLEFEPGPRWWEASALTTTLSFVPQSPSLLAAARIGGTQRSMSPLLIDTCSSDCE